ncbi:hypothetical protein ABK040_011586 [Willaertia magna]
MTEEKKILPQRSNRGRRMAELQGIDKEVDEEFWKMELFSEEAGDIEFENTEEKELAEQDIVDSDFSVSSADEEEEEERAKNIEKELEKEEKQKRKRKNVYKDLAKSSSRSTTTASSTTTPKKRKTTTKTPKTNEEVKKRSSTRESTKKNTEEVTERVKSRESKKTPKKKATNYYQPTQEELLEEAKITKEQNKASLEKLVQIEEDIRRKARESKNKQSEYDGPILRYFSKDGKQFISFLKTDIPNEINCKMNDEELKRLDLPKEEKQLKCVITGLPAKYKDPLTQQPYATIEAFKKIRMLYHNNNNNNNSNGTTTRR